MIIMAKVTETFKIIFDCMIEFYDGRNKFSHGLSMRQHWHSRDEVCTVFTWQAS
jgi:hypothetical protein